MGSSKTSAGVLRPFLWESGVIQEIPDLGGRRYGWAQGINDLDQVVGGQWNAQNNFRGFLWTKGSAPVDLGTLTGYYWSDATRINNNGQIVGYNYDPSRAIIRSITGSWQNLGTLGGWLSGASDINNVGAVVGTSLITGDAVQHGFLWEAGVGLTDIMPFVAGRSEAFGINDYGEVVGRASHADGCSHAFIWRKLQGLTDLGAPSGLSSRAKKINNFQIVVGDAGTFAADDTYTPVKALLWQGGICYDLNSLIPAGSGWDLKSALCINDQGQIVGWGYHNGVKEGFVLTPGY